MTCELCQAERITHWHYEDDLCWIADCKICRVPMAVLKRHTPHPTPEEREHMIAKLRKLFGSGYVDEKMRKIPDHYHIHLRPFLLEPRPHLK
ncbi:MAG: hypothetical protein ACOY9Y_11985 [Bacillota bacterium]